MHKAKYCIIKCIDFRFQKEIYDFLNENNYLGKSDIISIPGSSRNFVKPIDKSGGIEAWNEIATSIQFHDSDEIIFINHQDCGGYAIDELIPNNLDLDQDLSKHKIFIETLKDEFRNRYPDKKFSAYYVDLEKTFHKII